jgi:hypothetical protein
MKRKKYWYAVTFKSNPSLVYDFSIRSDKENCIAAWERDYRNTKIDPWEFHKVMPISPPRLIKEKRKTKKGVSKKITS